MRSIEVSGKTVDEAITNALLQLGASSDQVKIEVLEEGSKGLLGLFGKSAKVRASLKEDENEDIFSVKSSEKKAEPKKAAVKPAVKAEEKKAPKEEVESQESSKKENLAPKEQPQKFEVEAVTVSGEKVVIDDTIEQRIRKAKENEGRPFSEERPSYEKHSSRGSRPSDRQRRGGRYHERREQGFSVNEAELSEKPVFEQKVYEIPEDAEAVMAKTREFLSETLKAMGIDAQIETKFSEDGIMEVSIAGEGMGIIIGKRGATLDSLQYLTTLVINKDRDDHVRLKLDTEGYRARRQDTLEKLAINLAKKAKRTGHRVVLEPMNPYERRIIHSVLQADKGVETHSDGEEPYRKVIITPRRKR